MAGSAFPDGLIRSATCYLSFCAVSLCAALLTATAVELPVVAAQSSECSLIKQHSKIIGDIEIMFNRHGMRIFLPKSKTAIICKEPDWVVYTCNLQTNRYFPVPLAKYSNSFARTIAMAGAPTCSDIPVKKIKTETYLGLEVDLFKSGPEFEKKAEAMYQSHLVTGNYPSHFRMKTLLPGKYRVQEAHVLSVFEDLPDTGELPLSAHAQTVSTANKTFLETLVLVPNSSPDKVFDLPANLTKVASEAKLTDDSELDQDLIEFMGKRKLAK